MSDLQKKWAKAKLSSAMAATATVFNEADEDTLMSDVPTDTTSATVAGGAGGFPFPTATSRKNLSVSTTAAGGGIGFGGSIPEQDDDSSSASSMSSTGTVIPSPGRALFARPMGPSGGRSLDPIPWTTYFERELFLTTPPSTSSENGTETEQITHHAYLTSPVGPKGPLFVTHHGAGSSGLSFAVLSSEIRKRLPTAGILSIDARGHGSTTTTGGTPGPVDLSLSTLSTDLFNVIQATKTAMHWPELPPIILVGHSLGGAVVTDLAHSGRLSSTPGNSFLGYAVLDVVEGSAMDALQSMQTYLSTRPTGFGSLKDGIEWHVRSRTVKNAVSARTSVPALLVDTSSSQDKEDEKGNIANGSNKSSSRPWRWRTDLAATQPFWEDWFVGLSKKFLEAKGGKLLLLAGTDRLDTELTIGQMQGKYALQVFPEAGHFIHEDLPEKTANVLVDFYRRNDRSSLVLPPKVSELLAQGKRV
ncbi:Alpha/Beta hydrolase protein [Apodospora peruviana]|uniref:Protein phosphatase methylesterase 1 n=1 Tax=Apodospora peruviana TaxID=516989 RepID=A0AAE0MEN3_9PEZI|nr:Alpha/Beta hydrolase protein [Apodospora peruviana]